VGASGTTLSLTWLMIRAAIPKVEVASVIPPVGPTGDPDDPVDNAAVTLACPLGDGTTASCCSATTKLEEGGSGVPLNPVRDNLDRGD